VVDAGGYGLALLLEGFVSSALGRSLGVAELPAYVAPSLRVEPVDDWDDEEYLYCTEFLLFGDRVDREAVHDFVSSMGGSELVVGGDGEFKVHVHTNEPGVVLSHVTSLGEVAEVHINNMRRQQADRDEKLRAVEPEIEPRQPKPMGFVAVATGSGLKRILESLGVDEIVNGGQTMNPSTEDLLEAIKRVEAENVVILPNNKNIIMSATAAASVAGKPAMVVPTTSVPASFAALLAYDGSEDLVTLVEEMTEAASAVRTGEVTVAVKDAKGKAGDIREGQYIGILDDKEIEAVGDDIETVAERLVQSLVGDAETLTLFAGADYSDEALEALRGRLADRYTALEIEVHRGEQPLYPLIISAE
jgi:DAK2 domain fusion protein YloV